MAARKGGKLPESRGNSREPARPPGTAEDPGDARASYHHGDLRRALVDAAALVLQEGGIEALTLREAARRAGVSHAAPYRHFADKEALLAAVAEEGFRMLKEVMVARALPFRPGTDEHLTASGVGYVLFAYGNPAHFQLMFGGYLKGGPSAPGPHERYPGLAEASGAAYAHLTTSVAQAKAAGALRKAPEEELTLAAWSIVHGLAMLVVAGALGPVTEDTVEGLARRVTDLLVAGIGRP